MQNELNTPSVPDTLMVHVSMSMAGPILVSLYQSVARLEERDTAPDKKEKKKVTNRSCMMMMLLPANGFVASATQPPPATPPDGFDRPVDHNAGQSTPEDFRRRCSVPAKGRPALGPGPLPQPPPRCNQGFFSRPVNPNRRPPVPVYRTGWTGNWWKPVEFKFK